MVWSAEPGLDLFDDMGRVIRASAESDLIASYFTVPAGYPGFDQSLDDDFTRNFYQDSKPYVVPGTQFNRLISVTPVDRGYDAVYCRQSSHIGRQVSENRYLVGFYGDAATNTISLRHPSADAETSPAPTPTPPLASADHVATQPGTTQWIGPNTVAATPVLNRYVEVDVPPQTLPQYPTW